MPATGDRFRFGADNRSDRGSDVDPLWVWPTPAVLPAPLRPLVRRMAGYAADGLTPGPHRGLPGPSVTFVLAIDAPLGLATTAAGWARQQLTHHYTVVGGLHLEPVFLSQPGRWSGIEIDVHPLAARRLFGMPASALSGLTVDATDALRPEEIARVHSQLVQAPSWDERYTVVIDWLLGRLASSEPGHVRPDVVQTWRRLEEQRGAATVLPLAGHVALGSRWLARIFAAELGVTPKTAARLIRFDHARRRLTDVSVNAAQVNLSRIAVEHGYYDQAHLARDFQAFTGLSATSWLAAEIANIQADTGLDQAASPP